MKNYKFKIFQNVPQIKLYTKFYSELIKIRLFTADGNRNGKKLSTHKIMLTFMD